MLAIVCMPNALLCRGDAMPAGWTCEPHTYYILAVDSDAFQCCCHDDTHKTNKPCLDISTLGNDVLDCVSPYKNELFLLAEADELIATDWCFT